jgi:hypothetical protein
MASIFFQEMRTPHAFPPLPPPEPISVDLPDWLIKDFLNRIYTPFPPSHQGRFHFKTTSHKLYIRFYAFYQKFKIEEGVNNIQEDMKIHAAEDPWTYLVLGSRYNSTDLASLALTNMTPIKLADPLFWQHVNAIRPEWRSALLSSLFKRVAPIFDGIKTNLMIEDDPEMFKAGFLRELRGDVEVKEESEENNAEPLITGKKRKDRS